MREYLFRGKRKDNGEWVEGSLVTKVDPLLETNYCFILAQGRGESFVTWHMVDPSTVGQYTGLMDKNGKRIFEGDILDSRYDDLYPENVTIETVVWFRHAWHRKQGDYYPDLIDGEDVLPYSEVIGTIHDNPELEGVI